MKQKSIDLTPNDALCIALGKQITAFFRLEFSYPLPNRSYGELGRAFCDLVNAKTQEPTFCSDLVDDFVNCLADMSLPASQIFSFIKSLLTRKDSKFAQIIPEQVVTDPELADQFFDQMQSIKKNGLHSVIPLETIPDRSESTQSNNDSIIVLNGNNIDKYLSNGMRVFHLSRATLKLDADIISNIIIITALLVKSIHEVGLDDLFEQFMAQEQYQACAPQVQSLIKSSGRILRSNIGIETDFLCQLNFFDMNTMKKTHQSFIRQELNKNTCDLLEIVKKVMPVLSIAIQFCNKQQEVTNTFMKADLIVFSQGQSLFENKEYSKAYEELRCYENNFKKSKQLNFAQQHRYCLAVWMMAQCQEQLNQPVNALQLYYRSLSTFGHFHHPKFDDYAILIQEKIIALEEKLNVILRMGF